MAKNADIIIVGGGIMGASIAYYLAKEAAGRIILLERKGLCTGTTSRSGAIVRQHYSNDFTARMAKESLQIFSHFDEIIGGDCNFVTTGMLVVSDKTGASALQANVILQQEQGINTRLIKSDEINELAPGYSCEDVAEACYEADAGVADPVATTYCFARRACDLGVVLYEEEPVQRILTYQGHIVGVETSRNTFSAPIVVLATNVWSLPLVLGVGITLPVRATRHPVLNLRRLPDKPNGRWNMHAVCLDMIRDIYLRPDFNGNTQIGSTEEFLVDSEPDNYSQSLSEKEITDLHAKASKCIPKLAYATPRGTWAGLYDDTPDYHPILGALKPYESLYCAVGFSGHGFKLSPVVGQWMAQLITTGKQPEDMQHFSYERFIQGGEIRPRYKSGVLG
ncbi:MAG TPA: FAD-dependent oxidoreductase [Ktedonobacteraceae bacterium]|nr:FAD-dependent oxidoreductase [Ktedonobacteraceae bacterium]